MFGLSNLTDRVIAGVLVISIIVGGLWYIQHIVQKAAVLGVQVESLQKATEIAQEALTSARKADTSTRDKRRATLDSVRSKGILVQQAIQDSQGTSKDASKECDNLRDADFIRLLNNEIRAGNAGIAAARSL